jgi:RHS repeat-associated protein
VGGLLSVASASSSSFVAYDGNGNVVALVDASTAAVAAEYDYSPFGETLKAAGPAAHGNPFRFSTKYFEGALPPGSPTQPSAFSPQPSLYYYGYRYYSPGLGRWVSRDPIGQWGGANPLAFVAGDPVGRADVLGRVDLSGVVPSDARLLNVTFVAVLSDGRGVTEINGFRDKQSQLNSVSNMVKCVCSDFPIPLPVPGGSFMKKVTCSVSITFSAVLEDDRGSVAPDAIPTMLGVYGHEQRHVQNLLDYIMGTMVPDLAAFEAPLRECCPPESELRAREQAAINGFRARIWAEAGHAGFPFYGDQFRLFAPLPGTTPGIINQFYFP